MTEEIKEENAVKELYHLFRTELRDQYVAVTDEDHERVAFASGVVAALAMLDMLPEDVVSETTERSAADDLDEILIERSALQ